MQHNGKASFSSTRRRELAALVAAGLPLQHILRHLCSALAEDDSPDVIRHLKDIMSVSKRVRHTLLECGGLVPLPEVLLDSSEKAQQFATWLSKYGMLCSSMHIKTSYDVIRGPHLNRAQLAAVEQAISSALARAAEAAPQGLQLRSCTLDCFDRECASILQQLPCNHLTELNLVLYEHGQEQAGAGPVTDAFFTGIAAVMSGLTALCSLDLSSSNAAENMVLDPLLQPLSALTNLTSLGIARLASYQDMQYLPASLSELFFELAADRGDPSNLNLQHLTALTYLATDRSTHLQGNHILPLGLISLSVGNVEEAGCLLPLKQLQKLHVTFGSGDAMTAADLQQLSSLTSLQDVVFDYGSGWAFEEAACGLSFVPGLRCLALQCPFDALGIHVVQAMSKLQQLSELELCRCNIAAESSIVSATLQHMTALTRLDLMGTEWQVGSSSGAGYTASLPLVVAQSMTKLQRLQVLVLDGVTIGRSKAAAIAQLTQLTELHLNDCGLEDCSLLDIVNGLNRSLRSITFKENPDVTDAVLPVLRCLPPDAWNEYTFNGTSTTTKGLRFYLGLI